MITVVEGALDTHAYFLDRPDRNTSRIIRYDGADIALIPNPPGQHRVEDIFGAARFGVPQLFAFCGTDLFAWTGAEWDKLDVPAPPRGPFFVHGAGAARQFFVQVSGIYDEVLHYDGAQWSLVPAAWLVQGFAADGSPAVYGGVWEADDSARLLRWTGEEFMEVAAYGGGLNGVAAVDLPQGTSLVVLGNLWQVGGVASDDAVIRDATGTWRPLIDGSGPVDPRDIQSYAGDVYVSAKGFGGGTARDIGRWTGAGWESLPPFPVSEHRWPRLISETDNALIVATNAGTDGEPPGYVFELGDGTWQTLFVLGDGEYARVAGAFDFGGGTELYVAGWFEQSDGEFATELRRRTATGWENIADERFVRITALGEFDFGAGPQLVVAGMFGATEDEAYRVAIRGPEGWTFDLRLPGLDYREVDIAVAAIQGMPTLFVSDGAESVYTHDGSAFAAVPALDGLGPRLSGLPGGWLLVGGSEIGAWDGASLIQAPGLFRYLSKAVVVGNGDEAQVYCLAWLADADVNGFARLEIVAEAPARCSADIHCSADVFPAPSGDCRVDDFDLIPIIAHYGRSADGAARGYDLVTDGRIDFLDLGEVLADYGSVCDEG